ncbi:transketolase [bacterium]|nr:transketolase [bacterium]
MRAAAIEMVHELARRNPKVVFIGSDLGSGVLDAMKKEMPERFFMEGVSEANIIGMAAGLAMDGYIPYINTIATFLTRRCFEQVAVDLCLHRLKVRLIASGGGVVYAPLGPTHMAAEDMAILRALPNMTIVAPADAGEMRRAMEASLDVAGPLYIRVAKGNDPVVTRAEHGFTLGRAIRLRAPGRVLFVSTGVMSSRALVAADLLAAAGVSCGVLHVHTIKPLDREGIVAESKSCELLVTLEEHTLMGGLGSAVAEMLADEGVARPLLRLGLPDRFMSDYGSQDNVLERAGLAPPAIKERVLARLG